MPCHRCLADPQPKNFGSPRRCAFDDAGNFTPENWSCATLDALDDARGAANRLYEVGGFDETLEVYVGDEYGGFLVVTRYKHRGKVSSIVLIGDFWPPKPVTLAVVEAWLDGSYWSEDWADSVADA